MQTANLDQPTTPTRTPVDKSLVERACKLLARKDYLFMEAAGTRQILAQVAPDGLTDWSEFESSWEDLPVDAYMGDGGRYRRRRHATFSALPSSTLLTKEIHQPHYQSVSYNHLNGGIARHLEAVQQEVLSGSTMTALLKLGCEIFGRLQPYSAWHIEVHQFRIEAGADMQGLPTPEGVHRDGVNFVLMAMVKRRNLLNGSTSVFNLDKVRLAEFTLQEPLDLALVNDERVLHGVTPIVQLNPGESSTRDVLVITFRKKS